MSDIAHPEYRKHLKALRAMRAQVGVDSSPRAEAAFELACEQIAFSGLNVTLGRLQREFGRFLADPKFFEHATAAEVKTVGDFLDHRGDDIDSLPDAIGQLRSWVLFSEQVGFDSMPCDGEQFALLAIGALEQAERFATLALHAVRRARAGCT